MSIINEPIPTPIEINEVTEMVGSDKSIPDKYIVGKMGDVEVKLHHSALIGAYDLPHFTNRLINGDTEYGVTVNTQALNEFEREHALSLPWNETLEEIESPNLMSPESPWTTPNVLERATHEINQDHGETVLGHADRQANQATNTESATTLALIAKIQRNYPQFVKELDTRLKQLDHRQPYELYYASCELKKDDLQTLQNMTTIVQQILGEQISSNYVARVAPSSLFENSADIFLKPVNAPSEAN